MKFKFITYLLLIAFGFLFVPKSLWHTHESTHVCEDKEHDSSTTELGEDCFVCDFALQPALEPVAFHFQFHHAFGFVRPVQNVCVSKVDFQAPNFLRGPPEQEMV